MYITMTVNFTLPEEFLHDNKSNCSKSITTGLTCEYLTPSVLICLIVTQ